MKRKEYLELLKQGVPTWNHWRQENPSEIVDLSLTEVKGMSLGGANLSKANLTGTKFDYSVLIGADFFQSKMRGTSFAFSWLNSAKLDECDLNNASFWRSVMQETSLRNANLTRAHFRQADLTRADFTGANLSEADFFASAMDETNFSGAQLTHSSLRNAQLIKTNLCGANLSTCALYGVSVWDVKVDAQTIQSNLAINCPDGSILFVEDIEIAAFMYLILNNKKIKNLFEASTSMLVLLLGRFSLEGTKLLERVKTVLRVWGYIPVVFDFEKPTNRTTQETVTTLARLARFALVDISDPRSVPQELIGIVQSVPSLLVQPILRRGQAPWGMFDHIERYPWVLSTFVYNDTNDLLEGLREKIISHLEDATRITQAKGGSTTQRLT